MADNDFEHLLAPNPLPSQPPEDVIAWLRGKTREELKAIEIPGSEGGMPQQRFPDALRYRRGNGDECSIPVLFKIPNDDDNDDAAQEAIRYIAKKRGDPSIRTQAQAIEQVGAIRFANFETAAIVSLCTFDVKPPHPRAYLLPLLLHDFPADLIQDAFDRIELLRRTWTVRVSSLTEAQFWAYCAEIARCRNISPLAGLASALQDALMVRMANESLSYRMSLSSSGSNDSSTPE